jgi:hypothetical protein
MFIYYLDEFQSQTAQLPLLVRVSHVSESTSEHSVFHASLEIPCLLLCVYVVLSSVLSYCIYQHYPPPGPLPDGCRSRKE